MQGFFNKLQNGQLPDSVRNDIVSRSQGLMKSPTKRQQQIQESFTRRAKSHNLPVEEIVDDYTSDLLPMFEDSNKSTNSQQSLGTQANLNNFQTPSGVKFKIVQ